MLSMLRDGIVTAWADCLGIATWRTSILPVVAAVMAVAIDKAVFGLAGAQGVAKGDVLDVLAFDHQVRAANGIGLGVVFLAEEVNAGAGVQAGVRVDDELLRFGQHAAGAAGGVVNADDLGFFAHLVVMGEQHTHHELDDFTRRKVVASLFIGLFVEAPHQAFKQVANGDVGDEVGVQSTLTTCLMTSNRRLASSSVWISSSNLNFSMILRARLEKPAMKLAR